MFVVAAAVLYWSFFVCLFVSFFVCLLIYMFVCVVCFAFLQTSFLTSDLSQAESAVNTIT